MKTPDIKLNPHPKMRYEITLTIDDAPGPFESVSGYMQYEVTDRHCSPENPISGTWNPPFKDIPIVFTRMSDSIYTGTVYLDLLQDEDYYRLGVCHWAMVGTTMEIKTNEMMFNPHISSDKIAAQQSQTTYFAKADYENSARGGIATGSPNRGLFKPDSRADIFSMGLSAKESFR